MNALRSNLIILTLSTFLLGFFGCKTVKKATVSPNELPTVVKKEQDSKPYINAIRSNYILNDSSTATVYLRIDFKNLPEITSITALNDIFRTSWVLQPDFGIREKLESGKVVYDSESTIIKDGDYYLKFQIPKLKEHPTAILVMEFIDLKGSRKFTNESFIDFSGLRINQKYGMYLESETFPIFETAIKSGKSISIKSNFGGMGTLYLKKYNFNSLPALSPMSTSKRNELAEVSVEYVKTIKDGESIILNEAGNYCISPDSSSLDRSFGFVVVDEYFPRLVDTDELSGPLSYMSTNEEIKAFRDSLEAKDILDLYFLRLTNGNQAQAKSIIKSFYRRVAKTNELFTTYKEGWKTDQGMVYAIIGPPSSVQRNGKREVWLYNQGQSLNPIYFTFYRKSNELSDQNFELVRYPEYGAYWYPFVEAWRTGSVLE
ncbi:GWxTD domain-containing protein [Spirosomataceae bacterium TFI 002]|nr:GWxTD domain-containing protein [Spirosomataceae bacterium TFI 002]